MRVRADHPAPAVPLRPGHVEYPGSVTGDASLGTAAGPAGRVGTSLPELVEHVAAEYRLGDVGDWSVLATGYEDCNIDLRAGRARVVIKVFAAGRPAGIAARTAAIIAAVTAAGVRHPRLHADAAGGDVHGYDGHRLLVMDFAPGQTFYDLGRPPDEAELATVVEQAALHSRRRRPPGARVRLVGHRQPGPAGRAGRRPARRASSAASSTGPSPSWPGSTSGPCPATLIHADLTAGNVLLGPDGEITVLDFALANRWPRLQELAVIAASLLHGSPEALPARMDQVARLY